MVEYIFVPSTLQPCSLQARRHSASNNLLSESPCKMQDVVDMCDDILSNLSRMDTSPAAISSFLEVNT